MSIRIRTARLDTQTVGNIGLYFVCYRLSFHGWNVMPTARNARGIDIVMYSQDATKKHTIQVKTLSKTGAVFLGDRLEKLYGDFFIVCRNVASDSPECFILTPEEVRSLAHKSVNDGKKVPKGKEFHFARRSLAHKGDKAGKISYWLQPKKYATDEFREKWEERIGNGRIILPIMPPDSPPRPERLRGI